MTKLGNRIKAARKAKGLSQAQLGALIGANQTVISGIEVGSTTAPGAWRRLADTLEIPYDEMRVLMLEDGRKAGKTRLPVAVKGLASQNLSSGQVQSDLGQQQRAPSLGPRDVPVYGSAAGGDDGRFELNGEVQGWESRPPQLAGVANAYVVYVHGESMVPRYRPGEAVWVHPAKPVRRGDDVIVQVGIGESVPLGFVKEFVGYTPTKLVLRQYNPAEELTFDRDEVLSVHPIVFAQKG